MIKFIKENSPRPAATGRSEDTKYQLNYNTLQKECKDLFIDGFWSFSYLLPHTNVIDSSVFGGADEFNPIVDQDE